MLKKLTLASLVVAASISSTFAADKINGAGASFPAPLYYDWAYSYKKDTKNRVNYQSIGSGG
ncbi:MAG: phosphate ABC transporter substrate-binding protein PstS, partial [Campylobacterales bacterium]